MVDDSEYPRTGKHRDLEMANIRKSEEAVQQTEAAIRSFLNPFSIPIPDDPEDDRLYALHSGAPMPVNVEADVMRADTLGEQRKVTFVEQRLKTHEKSFFDPIKRQNLLTMDYVSKKVTLTTSQGKVNMHIKHSTKS